MSIEWDVLVIGRSYAGLSAALNLGRARRSVLVIGSGGPRNDAVLHAHGLITNDGALPAGIIAAAEAELAKYPTVEQVDARVTGLVATLGGFRASINGRTATASTVLIATGVNDNPPPIPGLAEYWGRGVLTCPYCDGFERADTHIAVMGSPLVMPHMTRLLTNWSDRVTAFHDGFDDATRADLIDHGVEVETRAVAKVIGDASSATALELDDGTVVPIGGLFIGEFPQPNNQLAVGLGCEVDEFGFVTADAFGRTTVTDVWAIGDVTSRRATMAIAIAAGVNAAADCNAVLLERRWAAHVAG